MTRATAGSHPEHPEVIIVGAGTFGSVLAARLAGGDTPVDTVVLDAGGWGRDEHVQTPPLAAVTVPPPQIPTDAPLRPLDGLDCWRVPWLSPLPYQGLAYGVGGRSRFWGAYCLWPQLTGAGAAPGWPADVAAAMTGRYLPAAAGILGLDTVPGHLDGPLSVLLRGRLRTALDRKALRWLTPLGSLPDHPGVPGPRTDPDAPGAAADPRLHLPMAARIGHDGQDVSFVRFSAASMLRAASGLSDGRGDKGRLEVRTDDPVLHLHVRDGHVHAVQTREGTTPVGPDTPVVLAAGTIENARLVLDAAEASGAAELPRGGTPFTTHLRSNVTVRIALPAELAEAAAALGAASLAVRGVTEPDGVRFHHQITSFPVGTLGPDAFRDLLASTPRRDVESLDRSQQSPPTHLVITVASVAETASEHPGLITLSGTADADGARRALVEFGLGEADHRAWRAMDVSADEVVALLAQGQDVEVLRGDRFVPAAAGEPGSLLPEAERHEGVGCGHHEMGSLAMNRPDGLATDADGLVRGFDNLYVAGPAAFPGLDSAGPVLPGIALTLRLADHLTASAHSRTTADLS